MIDVYMIDGDNAKALAVVESEMDALSERHEKEYTMLQDKMKEILSSHLKIPKVDIENNMLTLVAKYYPKFGVYYAELDKGMGLFGNDTMPAMPELKPTLN